MLSAPATTVGTMTWWQALSAAGVLGVVAMLAGIIVIWGRKQIAAPRRQAGGAGEQPPQGGDGDFIRSWAAIILVIGLITFCAFAFAVDDTTLRSTLIGGLIASVGSAIAFYFSSKAADKARQDVANAAATLGAGTDIVPSLIGKTTDQAAQILGKTSFSLIEDPGGAGPRVTAQNPAAQSNAPRGSSIVVTLGQ